jgi:ubiquinone biosynthesis protein
MVSGLFSTARELPRLREISSVFVRHGLGDLVRRAGVATLLEHAGQVLQWGEASEIAHLEPQQRAKLAFEQLGPTFVKLGQMLSTREDLLPPTWTTELARLHSDVVPVPFDDRLPQVEQALGRSPFEVFGNLEREPLRGRLNRAGTPGQTRQRHAIGPKDSSPRNRGKDRR